MRAVCRGAVAAVVSTMALLSMPMLAGTAHADSVTDEAAFVARINAVRAGKGLSPVVVDVRLTQVARAWSASMAGTGTLSHNADYAAQAPTTWVKLGENVGYGGSVDALMDAFVASPSHYRNIVDPAFNAVGVGVVQSGGMLWVTHNFMQGPVVTASSGSTGPGWYRLAGAGGTVYGFGSAAVFPKPTTSSPVAAVAATPSGNGYWSATENGGVFTSGDASFFGSAGAVRLNAPIVGMAATPTGKGYWLVGRDGGIFSFGDGRFFGSTGAMRLNQPVVSMAATPSGNGYWFVAADGGIFSFGDARFFGSTGAVRLNAPIVGMAATPSGNGYWLVGRDGGIFSFGDARFFGSTGAMRLNQPIVGMAATPTGNGYWFVAADGGVFSFGDAGYLGSTGGLPLSHPVVGMVGGL